MTGSRNRMPHRPGHLVGHLLVDGVRDKSIIQSLPHVDAPFDSAHVESPAPLEELAVANQPLAPLREALGAGFGEGRLEARSLDDLSIVVVDGFP